MQIGDFVRESTDTATQKQTIRGTSRGVSPVIGVILMVAITVILAAVIATFVLGLGDQIRDNPPEATFSFDLDNAADNETYQDSFAAVCDDLDGCDGESAAILTVRHTGGATITADSLSIAGSSPHGQTLAVPEADAFGADSEIRAGTDIEIWVADGDAVDVLWAGDNGQSAVLAEYRA